MGKKIDLTGQAIGYLLVLKEFGKDKHKTILWLCKCLNCYNFKVVSGHSLRDGKTKSCGCYLNKKHTDTANKNTDPSYLNNYLFEYKIHYGKLQRGVYVPCLNCGELFFRPVCNIKTNRGKFCSYECCDKYRIGKNHPTYVKRKKIKCSNCGKTIERKVNTLNKHKNNYCSDKCQREHMFGENASQWKGGKTTLVCEQCGKEYMVWPKDVKSGRKFCSYECRNKYYSIHYTGENSHSWQGGKSFEPYCEKFNKKKKEEIRDKFDNKCILCGKTKEENKNRELSVHHIDRNKDQGCNGHEWDLVPLCMSCHGKVHGMKNEDYWMQRIRQILSWRVIQT